VYKPTLSVSDDPAVALENLASVLTLSTLKQQLFITASERGIDITQFAGANVINMAASTESASAGDDVELF
jgi:hypothetical protein